MTTALLTPPAATDLAPPQTRDFRRLGGLWIGTGLGLAVLLAWLRIAWSSLAVRQLVHFAEPYAGAALLAAGGLVGTIGLVRSWRTAPAACDLTSDQDGRLRFAGPLSLAVTLILFTWPLFASLTEKPRPFWENDWDAFLLPYSDAACYYGGAQIVSSSLQLDSWNVRRPINALTLAARLALAGNDSQTALLVQGLLLGLAVWLFGAVVARDLGTAAGIVAVGILYAVGREWLAFTLSEALGMTWGTLATTLLWSGIRSRRPGIMAWGAFCLMMGQNCRAGALLSLPALVLWGGLAFRLTGRFNWRRAALLAGALALGVSLQVGCLRLYAGKTAAGQGNFSFTLYNLACGVPGWEQIYADYPQTRHMPEEERNAFIYGKAFERIRENPLRLVSGYFRGLRPGLADPVAFGARCLRIPPSRFFAGGLLAVFVLFVHWAWKHRREADASFLMTQAASIVLSVPLVVPTSGVRTLAASYATMALIPLVGMVRRVTRQSVARPADLRFATRLIAGSVALAILLTLAPLCGPGIVYGLGTAEVPRQAETDDHEEWAVIRTGPGSPHLRLPAPGNPAPSVPPVVRRDDLALRIAAMGIREDLVSTIESVNGPAVVVLAADLRPGHTRLLPWLVAPAKLVEDDWRWWRVRLEKRASSHWLVTQAEPLD